ncbi:MAG: DegV family protein [Clostridia bacterium]|nr:DegV family protein [Clostridia bacterium]
MFVLGEERVALVTDTACDLSDAQLAADDIRTVPLRIATSHGEFRDRVEIRPDELYEMMKTELPKTSLPLPADVSRVYQELAAAGATRILHLSISSGLSGAFNMASMVASETENVRVDVVDTQTLSAGEGLLVLTAARCLREGMSVEETIRRVAEKRANQLGTFVIRTLEYLRKGGRIGLVEGVVGSLLQIKPVIYVNGDGVYQTLTKARGFSKALDAMEGEFYRRYEGKRVQLAIVHGNAYEDACRLQERILSRLDAEFSFVSPVSPALAIHTGPGLLGIIAQLADGESGT